MPEALTIGRPDNPNFSSDAYTTVMTLAENASRIDVFYYKEGLVLASVGHNFVLGNVSYERERDIMRPRYEGAGLVVPGTDMTLVPSLLDASSDAVIICDPQGFLSMVQTKVLYRGPGVYSLPHSFRVIIVPNLLPLPELSV